MNDFLCYHEVSKSDKKMEGKIKIFFHASVSTILIVLGLSLVSCGRLEAITVGDKTYTFGESTDQKDQAKAVETLSGANKDKNDLISGLEIAISTMENWDDLPPEKRQSVINSLKDMVSQNR